MIDINVNSISVRRKLYDIPRIVTVKCDCDGMIHEMRNYAITMQAMKLPPAFHRVRVTE